ncbi:hypothetical protein A2U01_0015759, partial [Trifolium medium]|nr:hypothetical protein [Trifolium medium]
MDGGRHGGLTVGCAAGSQNTEEKSEEDDILVALEESQEK